MNKTIKIINDELVEIASYRNPEIVFHNSNNPSHLKPEYDNFESYCDFKEVINPFELYAENQQLKKQKEELKDILKIKLARYRNEEDYYLTIEDFEDLLRMLGEIDVED